MIKVITREQTKQMVRSLEENVEPNIGDHIEKKVLCYGGYRVEWCTKGRIPENVKSLGIPMTVAYKRGRDGRYKRKNLGELDELFYKAVNGSEVVRDFKIKEMYSEHLSKKVNKKLRYFKMFILLDYDEDKIVATYKVNQTDRMIGNTKYRNMEGIQLGDSAWEYIRMGDYEENNLEDMSNKDLVILQVSDKSMEFWNGFIEAVLDFDELLSE